MSIALCHGTFDILHPGHLALFDAARRMAGLLVITITADEFVEKGAGRPVFADFERLQMLKPYGNIVELVKSRTALQAIEKFKPDFFVKGGDYQHSDKLGNLTAEIAAVKEHGGQFIMVPHTGHSTTQIIERIRGIS